MWSVGRNYGLGSSPSPPECGPRREIMVLGQALMAGSVVQGAKPCPWVKPRLARVWSEERNYGLWSNAGGGKYGPGRETAGLGQAPPRPSVVRGEKLWSLVKRWWREVWFREQNRAPGSSPSECGPRREIMVLGQALVAGSMVQGAKLRVWVKHWWREVWSREPNCDPGSSPAEVWSREQNRAPGSPPAPVWSRERNCGPGSSPSPPECGLGSKTVPPGHPQPRPSVVQGAKLRPWVKPRQSMVQGAKLRPWVTPCPARVWSREPNCGLGSSPTLPKYGPGSQTAALGHPLPRRSMV